MVLSLINTNASIAQNFNRHGKHTQYQKSWFSFLFPTIKGSGLPLVSERFVKPFHTIVVEDPFRVVIQQGVPHQVIVVADDTVLEYVRTTVSNDGILTVAMDTQNYEYDTLAVFITTPRIDAITLGINVQATVNAPLSLEHLTTTIAGVGSEIVFLGGTIRNHTIAANGIGSSIDAVSVTSQKAVVYMPALGGRTHIHAAQIEPIGVYGIGSALYYSPYNAKMPELVGSDAQKLEEYLIPLSKQFSPALPQKSPQQPLLIPPKK